MGLLVDGKWTDTWYDTKSTGGSFVRQASRFRDKVERTEGARFRPEAERYHLYVSLACPWAHRTLIVRALKGLEEVIPVSIVMPLMLENGWTFGDAPGRTSGPVPGAKYLYEVYRHAAPDYTGRVTVPILWDKREGTIVNNESSEILRMFNDAFDDLATKPYPDLYPEPLRGAIDEINATVYDNVNNGVYKAGFATSQKKYDEAVRALFGTLDDLERRLADAPYLVGERITEADWRLFTTLVRFDAVYHGHFKCNVRRIIDYPHLHAYMHRLLAVPGVRETVNLDEIKTHYYGSHRTINPTGIVPIGPASI